MTKPTDSSTGRIPPRGAFPPDKVRGTGVSRKPKPTNEKIVEKVVSNIFSNTQKAQKPINPQKVVAFKRSSDASVISSGSSSGTPSSLGEVSFASSSSSTTATQNTIESLKKQRDQLLKDTLKIEKNEVDPLLQIKGTKEAQIETLIKFQKSDKQAQQKEIDKLENEFLFTTYRSRLPTLSTQEKQGYERQLKLDRAKIDNVKNFPKLTKEKQKKLIENLTNDVAGYNEMAEKIHDDKIKPLQDKIDAIEKKIKELTAPSLLEKINNFGKALIGH